MSSMAEKKERKLHYDLLRILAAFSVVMLHSAAQFWYDLDVRSSEWVVANSYDALFRFGVPIFVMLSGAIFLDEKYELNIKRLYKHNIFRMILLYVIWSCAYGLYDSKGFDFETVGIKVILREMLMGRYHLWFLPMLVGIYMLLPILKSWVKHAEKKNVQYFLVLFFGLQICRETIRALTVTEELHHILNLAEIEMACGYIGYFVWGYYLVHIGISQKLRKIIYWLCIPAVLLNVILGNVLAWRAGTPVAAIYDSFGLFTFILVTAIFDFMNRKGYDISFRGKRSNIVKEIATDTLGIYVLHVGVMEFLQAQGIHSMVLPNIVGIPIYAILCFVICLLLTAILRRIPGIGRFLC